VSCTFCAFPPLHLCFLAKNINKTIEHSKYKMYQKAGRNRPNEQSNIIYSSMCKTAQRLTGLAFVEFVFVSKRKTRAK
jgi:hypothetical protein